MKILSSHSDWRSIVLRSVFINLCFLSIPVSCRIVNVISKEGGWLKSDIAGFTSDAGVAIVVAFFYSLIAWKSRIVAAIFPLLWCVLHCANFEHVSANGGLVSLSYIGHLFNPVFFYGSAVAVSNKPLIIALIICSLAVFTVRPVRPAIGSIIIIPIFMAIMFFLQMQFSTFMDPQWRRSNVLHANAENLYFSLLRQNKPVNTFVNKIPFDSLRRKDLNGITMCPQGQRSENVLLILMEGCCGGMLPSLAAEQGIKTDFVMHGLDSIAQHNLTFTNFITHQRQTNRGEFAILSGTLPKLNSSTPKMTEFVSISRAIAPDKRKFLPAFLAAHGYETTYLQAAPLNFMLKDVFMPRIGFQESFGTNRFQNWYAKGYWGVDDKAFFEQALKEIHTKQKSGNPWFLTLLTVGTHHPITIPEDYGDPAREDARVRAFRYLDEAVSSFITRLSATGILRNTLVIITCDESQGVSSRRSCTTNDFLCQQWGLCIVLHPHFKEGMHRKEWFSSSDIPLSVLDYLNFSTDSVSFRGRSMFRKYTDGRDIYFSNTYGNVTGRFCKDNHLDICSSNLHYGERYKIDSNRLFSADKKKIAMLGKPALGEIGRFAEASNASLIDPAAANHTFDFFTGIIHQIEPGGQRDLLSGQYVTIPKNCQVKVKYRGHVLPGDSSHLFLKHDIVANNGRMRIVEYMHVNSSPGDTFSTSYEFYTTESYYFTEFRATAEVIQGASAKIILDEASISYTCRPPTESERKKYLRPFNKNVGRVLNAPLVIKRG